MKLLPLGFVFLFGATLSADAVTIWINEIHYDNFAADLAESVEIAGPAGTNLTGYTLFLYNGAGGATYDSFALSGLIPNQQNGFGTISISTPAIQNGAPDGLALAQGTTLLQFLSYEGTFAGTNGVANGVTSTDIGVAEADASSNPSGRSLQLIGAGTRYEDFTWSGPTTASAGAINANQSFAVPESGSSFLLLGFAGLALPLFKRRIARGQ